MGSASDRWDVIWSALARATLAASRFTDRLYAGSLRLLDAGIALLEDWIKRLESRGGL